MTETRSTKVLERVATVLLAIAAVATAWSSYQATRWNGEQAALGSRASALRIQSTSAADEANSAREIDIATFIQWVDAQAAEDDELADFYRGRFRPEFESAFAAWLETSPLTETDAPTSPFVMPDYRLAAAERAADLEEQADALSAQMRRAIQRSGNYVLAVVLFSVALFFGGMSTKLESFRLRGVLLGLGCAVLVGTVAWLVTMPVVFNV
jgi:hypothetical protein